MAEGGALLRRYTGLNPYRGFESLSLRQYLMSFFTALVLLAAEAVAQPVDAQACASCHGSRGEGGLTGAPRLAGLPRDYFTQQLAAYADGARQHSVMTPIARALTAQEREALADYYAGLRVPPTPPQVGSNDTLVLVVEGSFATCGGGTSQKGVFCAPHGR